MPYVTFIVVGEPVAKARPRVVRTAAGVRSYTPAKTERYEDSVSHCAQLAMASMPAGTFPIQGAVTVQIDATFPRSKRLFRKMDPIERIPRGMGKDLDNVIKSILDGINRSGLWRDDSQVACIHAYKWTARIINRKNKQSESPRAMITVKWEEEDHE